MGGKLRGGLYLTQHELTLLQTLTSRIVNLSHQLAC